MNHCEEWRLTTRRIGRRVLIFDQLDSTSTYAAALAEDPDHDGVVVLAKEQRAGRGRQGRKWHCPPGAGVLLSVLLFPPAALRRPVILTAWAAVSVCLAVKRLSGLEAQIKWPNDVLIQGRKTAGILIEQARATVAGVGLNLNQSADSLGDDGLSQAASLGMFTNQNLDWKQAAQTLIQQMDEQYELLVQGHWASLEEFWKERLGVVGEVVTAECVDGVHRGRLRSLTWDCVELELPEEETLSLRPEMIIHLHRSNF